MPNAPLVRTFARFEDLEPARAELLAAGLPPEAVQSRMLGDEAGPVEGNFVAGNGRREEGSGPSRGVIAGGEIPYDRNFARTVSRGVYLLIVTIADGARRVEVGNILDRFATVDPTALPAGRAASGGQSPDRG